jgi:hypothetical protein
MEHNTTKTLTGSLNPNPICVPADVEKKLSGVELGANLGLSTTPIVSVTSELATNNSYCNTASLAEASSSTLIANKQKLLLRRCSLL